MPRLTTPHKKKKILEILAKNKGIIKTACEDVGITRKTFYEWLQKDAKFKEQYDEILAQAIEHVEGKLNDIIDEGNYQAINFYLRNKAKEKWADKQQIEQDIKIQPVKIEIIKPKE